MPSQEQIDRSFLHLALVRGLDMSKDPSRKVGCVLVSPSGTEYSLGYNGFPRGLEETPERWSRPAKYEYVIHSEENALLWANFDTVGGTIYTPLPPCHSCMRLILNAGVSRVVWYHDPVEFIHTRPDIFQELLSHVQHAEYELDPIARAIIAASGHAHDGYVVGGPPH